VSSRELTYAAYALVALAVFVLQVACALRGTLTLGRIWHWMARSSAGLLGGLLLWAWLGWHLFVRGAVHP
jgi:hypothetical protein